MDFLIQILSKCERSKNASRAKKINTSQDLSRLNVRRIIILLLTLVIINMKSCSIIRKFVRFLSYINNCDRHFSWKMCSKPLKKHSNQKKAVLNLCGVMIYNIVDGLSKLLCDPLPYLKTKKNDLITTYAKRGTTTVHYLKLICARRCATMSFVYFLNVWVINLDRKGYWITESEWEIVHCPTHYFNWGQRGLKIFRPSGREKVFVELLLFKF